jgi:hypothetical protein
VGLGATTLRLLYLSTVCDIWNRIMGLTNKQQGMSGKTHDIYFLTFNPTNLVFLMSYLGEINTNFMAFTPLIE